MAPFQAYCNDINDDGNFVLTFDDSHVADEWWRAILETPAVASFFTRITPQLYKHDANLFNLSNFFTDPRTQSIASRFKGQFSVIDDKSGLALPIVQHMNVTEVRSGRRYSIRAPSLGLYWHYNALEEYLTLSNAPHTCFIITGINVPVDTLLTDTDEVTL